MNCTICKYFGKCKLEEIAGDSVDVVKGSWWEEHGIKVGSHKIWEFLLTKEGALCSFFRRNRRPE